MRATWPVHLIPTDLITMLIFSGKVKAKGKVVPALF